MSDDEKIKALAAHFKVSEDTITESHDEYTVESEPGEYAVMSEDEADEAWDHYLESYIDDCILGEMKNETLAQYFDRDAWKRDAKHDGRGYCLSPYDGEEHEIKVDGTWYFIYRTN